MLCPTAPPRRLFNRPGDYCHYSILRKIVTKTEAKHSHFRVTSDNLRYFESEFPWLLLIISGQNLNSHLNSKVMPKTPVSPLFILKSMNNDDGDGARLQYGVGIKQVSHLLIGGLIDYHPHSYFRVKQTFAGMVDVFQQQFLSSTNSHSLSEQIL